MLEDRAPYLVIALYGANALTKDSQHLCNHRAMILNLLNVCFFWCHLGPFFCQVIVPATARGPIIGSPLFQAL